MRFGTWNVRRLYRAVPLRTVTSELEKHTVEPLVPSGGNEYSGFTTERSFWIR